MSTAIQMELPGKPKADLPGLVSVQTFAGAFRPDGPLTPAEVMLRIQDGRHAEHIAWAFNIAAPCAVEQMEVRILSHLIAPIWRGALVGNDPEFGLVVNLIFPANRHSGRNDVIDPKKRYVLGTEIQAAWSCSAAHVQRLPFRVIRAAGDGPNGSPAFAFDSVVEFLRARCLRWQTGVDGHGRNGQPDSDTHLTM
jgi:hypothetical protein